MNTSSPESPAGNTPARRNGSNHLTMALAVGTMTLCGITGVLMFFHFRGPLMNELHIWSGLALVVAMVLHLTKYRRPLANHLRHWPVWGLLVVALVLVGAAVLSTPAGGRHSGPGGHRHSAIETPEPAGELAPTSAAAS